MRGHWKFWPALFTPSSALITPLPDNEFPNILAANVPNNVGRNPPFCSFASFLILSLIPFINYPDSLCDLIIFIISSISSFEIIKGALSGLR